MSENMHSETHPTKRRKKLFVCLFIAYTIILLIAFFPPAYNPYWSSHIVIAFLAPVTLSIALIAAFFVAILIEKPHTKDTSGWIYFAISAAVFAYIWVVIDPFLDTHIYIHYHHGPGIGRVLEYYFLTVPVLIAYSYFVLNHAKKIVSLRFLNYPLSVITIYFLFYFSASVSLPEAIFPLLLVSPLVLIAVASALVIGIAKDRKYRLAKKIMLSSEKALSEGGYDTLSAGGDGTPPLQE